METVKGTKKGWMVVECVVQSQDRLRLAQAWGCQVPTNPLHTLSSCLLLPFLSYANSFYFNYFHSFFFIFYFYFTHNIIIKQKIFQLFNLYH